MSEAEPIKKSVFNPGDGDGFKSPEKVGEYIRVATPGLWLIALAMALLLAALLIWGFTGALPVHYNAAGVGMTFGVDLETADLSDPEAFRVEGLLCFVDAAEATSHELQDKQVSVRFSDGVRATGTSVLIDTTPEKDEEIAELLAQYGVDSAWVFSRLGNGGYRYPVYVLLDQTLDYLYWGEIGNAAIIISEERPIHFLLNGEI